MTTECPYCKSQVSEDNQVFLLKQIKNFVETTGGWSIFEYEVGSTYPYAYPKGKEFAIAGKPAKVVDAKISYSIGDLDTDYYGSELPQGTTFDVWVVIEYAGSFFKKTGSGDSYGEVSWDGELLPVVPKVKTIEVYEFGG